MQTLREEGNVKMMKIFKKSVQLKTDRVVMINKSSKPTFDCTRQETRSKLKDQIFVFGSISTLIVNKLVHM